MKEKPRYFVYLLRLEGGSLYTGYTRDLSMRFRRHCRGTASRYTRSFPPVAFAACWEVFGGRGVAMSVEAFVKACPHGTKELLAADPCLLGGRFEAKTGRAVGVVPVPAPVRDPPGTGRPAGRSA